MSCFPQSCVHDHKPHLVTAAGPSVVPRRGSRLSLAGGELPVGAAAPRPERVSTVPLVPGQLGCHFFFFSRLRSASFKPPFRPARWQIHARRKERRELQVLSIDIMARSHGRRREQRERRRGRRRGCDSWRSVAKAGDDTACAMLIEGGVRRRAIRRERLSGRDRPCVTGGLTVHRRPLP